jgi:hypothetical protein
MLWLVPSPRSSQNSNSQLSDADRLLDVLHNKDDAVHRLVAVLSSSLATAWR